MTLPPITAQICILGFASLMLWAAATDVRSLTIPNRISVAIVMLYPAYVLAAGHPVDWSGALIVAGSLLAVGFVAFALGLIGGGDAKLLTAGALWAGPAQLMEFLFLTALAGGGMATVLWLRHRLSRAAAPAMLLSTPSDPDFAKQPMPYAVAVAAGALYVAFTNLSIG